MKYAIGLTQRVLEETTVYIDAESPEDAEEQALALALDGKVEWRFLEALDHPFVETVEQRAN